MLFLAGSKDVFEKAYQKHIFTAQKPTIYEDFCISLHSNHSQHVTTTELQSYKNDCEIPWTLNLRVVIFILLYKCPSSVNSLYLKSLSFASNFCGYFQQNV